MQLSDMKKAMFGYKRNDVYKYFDEISNDFSERLKKAEEAGDRQIKELTKENEALKAQIEELKRENEKYRAKEAAVSDSIIDARKYADSLKEKNEQLFDASRKELMEEFALAKQHAKKLLSGVSVCKESIANQLDRMLADLTEAESMIKAEIDHVQNDIDEFDETADKESLSLFHLRKE